MATVLGGGATVLGGGATVLGGGARNSASAGSRHAVFTLSF